MPAREPEDPDRILSALLQRIRRSHRIDPEILRARREFFGMEQPVGRADPAAEARFLEWFLLERESEMLGAVPVEAVPEEEGLDALAESWCGVFSVAHTAPARATLTDLQDGRTTELRVDGSPLQVGDLVVGRLLPGAGAHRLAASAAVFRPGAAIAKAFQRDLERLALDRRLTQQELERLLLGQREPQGGTDGAGTADRAVPPEPPAVPLEHLEADLENLLQDAGSDVRAADLSMQLVDVERPGRVIGPMLEQLAFETSVDLDRVRRLLHEIWQAHAALRATEEGEPQEDVAPAEHGLGAQLAQKLEEGLSRQRDVEELFAEIGRMAGMDPSELDEDDDEEEFVELDSRERGEWGDLEPLVEEYLWEQGLTEAPEAKTLRLWVELQGNAALPRTDLALVTGKDMMRVLLHVYLGASPGHRADAVRTAYATMEQFVAWARETHEVAASTALEECRGALLDQLDRLQAASHALSTEASSGRPVMGRVEELHPRGFGLRLDGGDAWWVEAAAPTCAMLRNGDLVLGAVHPGKAGTASLGGMVVVLPADAEELVG
jgi:hypothetical protein